MNTDHAAAKDAADAAALDAADAALLDATDGAAQLPGPWPVVLVHGTRTSHSQWDLQLPSLAPRGTGWSPRTCPATAPAAVSRSRSRPP